MKFKIKINKNNYLIYLYIMSNNHQLHPSSQLNPGTIQECPITTDPTFLHHFKLENTL